MFSLNGSLRTCKVSTGWAPRLQSDRFENPNLMVCPVWNGFDNAGRPVAPDSFMTKRAGCNSPEDRVTVENALRPEYSSYITLNTAGISAPLYGSVNQLTSDAAVEHQTVADAGLATGNFGLDGPNVAYLQGACPVYAYNQAQAQTAAAEKLLTQQNPARQAQFNRTMENFQNGMQTHNLRQSAGNGW